MAFLHNSCGTALQEWHSIAELIAILYVKMTATKVNNFLILVNFIQLSVAPLKYKIEQSIQCTIQEQ